MSPLAFDKQGKPFSWHARTDKLRVRLFRNPSARGTCCQVLDNAGGPLYVDADIDYTEFRRAIGNAPGLYRLDQCDEDGVEIDGAAPAYVSIENVRNGSSGDAGMGDASPLVIIEHMVATQADVMKTIVSQQAALMSATAEIMRAPYRPAPLPAATTELRNAEAPFEKSTAATEILAADDDDEEDEENELEANPWSPILQMLEPHLPQLGAFLYQKFVEFVQRKAPLSAAPAATSGVPATAESTPHATVVVGAAEPRAPVVEPRVHNDSSLVAQSAPPPSTDLTPASPPTAAPTRSTDGPRNAPPMPTPEQFTHLFAIRERLSPKERAIAEAAIAKMEPEMLAHWLGQLSAMSLDDATTTIRTMVAQIRAANGKRGEQP